MSFVMALTMPTVIVPPFVNANPTNKTASDANDCAGHANPATEKHSQPAVCIPAITVARRGGLPGRLSNTPKKHVA
jgi:hypothetical protein